MTGAATLIAAHANTNHDARIDLMSPSFHGFASAKTEAIRKTIPARLVVPMRIVAGDATSPGRTTPGPVATVGCTRTKADGVLSKRDA